MLLIRRLVVMFTTLAIVGCATHQLDGSEEPLSPEEGAVFARVADTSGARPINRIIVEHIGEVDSQGRPKTYTLIASRAYRGESTFFASRLPLGDYRIKNFQNVYMQGDLMITQTYTPENDSSIFNPFVVEAQKATTLGVIHNFSFYDHEAGEARFIFIHTPSYEDGLVVDGIFPAIDLANIEVIEWENQTSEQLNDLVFLLPRRFMSPSTDSTHTTYVGLVMGGVLEVSADGAGEIHRLPTLYAMTEVVASPDGHVAAADDFGRVFVKPVNSSDWIEYRTDANLNISSLEFNDQGDLQFFTAGREGVKYQSLSATSGYTETSTLFENPIRHAFTWRNNNAIDRFIAADVYLDEWDGQQHLSMEVFRSVPGGSSGGAIFVGTEFEHFAFDMDSNEVTRYRALEGPSYHRITQDHGVTIGWNRFFAPAYDSGYEIYRPDVDRWVHLEGLSFSACRDFPEDDDICDANRRLKPLEINRRTERVTWAGQPMFTDEQNGIVIVGIRHTQEQARILMDRDEGEDIDDYRYRSQILRTTDGGANWIRIDDAQRSRSCTTLLRYTTEDIVIGCGSSAIIRSTDQGASWAPVNYH